MTSTPYNPDEPLSTADPLHQPIPGRPDSEPAQLGADDLPRRDPEPEPLGAGRQEPLDGDLDQFVRDPEAAAEATRLRMAEQAARERAEHEQAQQERPLQAGHEGQHRSEA